MLFNSVAFLLFFPIVCTLYFILPHRFRYLLLLAAGYVYYAYAEPKAVLVLLSVTLVTWICGRLLYEGKKPALVGIPLVLCALAWFKYASHLFSLFTQQEPRILLPVGISFFTFQSITYLMDCYRRECEPERNFLKYALFVSFFPTILSGPILRAKDWLPQLDEEHDFDPLRASDGLRDMLWGYFLKMVIASRLAIVTDLVYGDPSFTGLSVLVAMLAYSLQIYCDFAGYSYLAVGTARILGFFVPQNFRQPYLSASLAEFWRRWHISLSSWFKDYLYIPLGGNRKGRLCKYRNIMIVFLVSGIWHGASLTFLLWGFLHGIAQVLDDLLLLKHPVGNGAWIHRLRVCLTFLFLTVTWVFFRAPSIADAFALFGRLFASSWLLGLTDGTLVRLGLGVSNLLFVLFAILILIAADLWFEKKNCTACDALRSVPAALRWSIYYVLLIMILFSVNLSTQEFLYMSF